MACILNIETSTSVCSISLSNDSKILFNKSSFEGPAHAALIGSYSEEALKVMKEHNLTLDAVAVSCGPGSYTGLRIGVSFAKGVCFGYDIPLIAIPTLELLAVALLKKEKDIDNKAILCPMLDARRMEVYTTLLDQNLNTIEPTQALIVEENSFTDRLKDEKIYFFGNGAMKCTEILSSHNAIFVEEVYPLAENMVELAEKAFEEKSFQNVAYYEPFYLKEFQATIAKNKVLGDHK